MKTPVTAVRVYVLVWAGLIAFLLLTWGVAQLNLGPFNALLALTIAILKMLLVMLFFMHLRHSSSLTWLFVAAGFIWFLIMADLTLSDYLTRSQPGREAPVASQTEGAR